MALPHNEWLEIRTGPGMWDLVRDFFRDKSEDMGDEKARFSVFRVSPGRGLDKKRLAVLIMAVERAGDEGGRGFYFYELRGIIAKIGATDWPHPCGADNFKAFYDPVNRQGSFMVVDTRPSRPHITSLNR